MHRTTIVVPDELLWQLGRIAAEQGSSMAAVMHEALEESDARGGRGEGPQLRSAPAEPGERCVRSRRYCAASGGGASGAAAMALILSCAVYTKATVTPTWSGARPM